MKYRHLKKIWASFVKPHGLKTNYDWHNYDIMKGINCPIRITKVIFGVKRLFK